MMRLLVVSAIVAFAAADVSHLLRKPTFQAARPAFQAARPVFQAARTVVPIASGPVVGVIRSESNINPDGSYQFSYENENGIAAQEQGQQKPVGQESGNAVQGSYQYISPEGVPVVVQYIADENGFQPSSDVLPTPPPIPAAILRAIEYNAAHPKPQQRAAVLSTQQQRAGIFSNLLGRR